jgi:hypothetical protein
MPLVSVANLDGIGAPGLSLSLSALPDPVSFVAGVSSATFAKRARHAPDVR